MSGNFSQIIVDGLNDPNCSFYVGQMMGQYTTFKLIGLLFIMFVILKMFDKLLVEPIIEKFKKRISK